MADLNKELDYTLAGKVPTITAAYQSKIDSHQIIDKECWSGNFCNDFKQEVKKFYARRQGHKCAYCRVRINPDGYTDPIEHITPRKLKPFWMFVLHNLVVSCGGCNSSKSDDNVLVNPPNSYGHNKGQCCDKASDYNVFNPHFDKWSDHFEVENDCFLKPKPNTKGPFTYQLCNMYRYHIVVDYLGQLSMHKPQSSKLINRQLRKEKNPDKIASLKLALECILETD